MILSVPAELGGVPPRIDYHVPSRISQSMSHVHHTQLCRLCYSGMLTCGLLRVLGRVAGLVWVAELKLRLIVARGEYGIIRVNCD